MNYKKKVTDGRNLISRNGLANLMGVKPDVVMKIAKERHWRAMYVTQKVVMFDLSEFARDFDDEAVELCNEARTEHGAEWVKAHVKAAL